MERFEYKVIGVGNTEEVLNKLGAESWELVCVDDGLVYLKRTTYQAHIEFQTEVLDKWGILSEELELESG